MKVIYLANSSVSGICQNPILTSSLLKIQVFKCFFHLWLELFTACTPSHRKVKVGTTTMSVLLITPKSSMRDSSSLTFCTLVAIELCEVF